MSGSDLQGRWMPSSVTEEDVLKLREARYLTYEISPVKYLASLSFITSSSVTEEGIHRP